MQVHDRIRTLADILPVRARVSPRKIALRELGDGGRLIGTSFAELGRQVDAFAARLAESGAGPERTVSLLMPNSRRWVVAYYAVFRLGAVAVPLEYDMLGDRPDLIRYALDQADARIVVCEPDDARRVRPVAGAGREIVPAQDAGKDSAETKPPRQPPLKPDDLAQILYTSGTTGPKKGVELTHGNIIFNVRQSCARLGVARNDCLPALLPYHHAYPLTATVVLPLYAGARMVVGDIKDRRSRELLQKCRPTIFVGVPRVFEAILQSIRATAARTGRSRRLEKALGLSALAKNLTGVNVGKVLFRRLHRGLLGGTQLRFCVSGGARIATGLLRDYFLMGIPIVQGWGMSELSPVGAAQHFRPVRFYFTRHYERKAGSIGTPLDGTEIALVQSARESLSLDVRERGEMVIRGAHVMRGYHKDPQRTAQQMTAGGLRSGDIVRRDQDGDLYVVGRVKHVIVLASGKKVFPEDDLDEELSRCATIEEFAVRPIADEGGAEQIGIVVRPNPDALKERGVRTLADLYGAVKQDMDAALRHKPDYMRRYDFCLTAWTGDGFAELVKSALGEPCPLKNLFTPETSYSRMKASTEGLPWQAGNA